MEKIDRRNTDCCSMNHSNLLELDGYYVCSKCGRCQSDKVFTSASTNLKSNIEKVVIYMTFVKMAAFHKGQLISPTTYLFIGEKRCHV